MEKFLVGRGNEYWAIMPDLRRMAHDIDPIDHMPWTPPILESEIPMDVYVSNGRFSDPNQFQNDATYKKTKKLTLRTNDLDFLQLEGFTVTVYVAAIDEHANTLLYNNMRVSFEDSSHTPYASLKKE